MMISRKAGPPVPPRPSAAAVATALSKGHSVTPAAVPLKQQNDLQKTTPKMQPNHNIALAKKGEGRTVVYKSPSHDATAYSNESVVASENKQNNNHNNDESNLNSLGMQQNTNSVNSQHLRKTEVNDNIANNNINKNMNNVQLTKIDNIYMKKKLISPVAKPRLNIPLKKLENNTIDTNLTNISVKNINIQQQQHHQQYQNVIEITSNQNQLQQQQQHISIQKQVQQQQKITHEKSNLINTSEFINMNNNKNNRYNNNINNNKLNDKSSNIIVSSATTTTTPVAAAATAATTITTAAVDSTLEQNSKQHHQQQQLPQQQSPQQSIYQTNSNQIIEINKSVLELERENNLKNKIKNNLFTEIIINSTCNVNNKTKMNENDDKLNSNIVKLECRTKVDKKPDDVTGVNNENDVKTNANAKLNNNDVVVDNTKKSIISKNTNKYKNNFDKKVEFHEMLISELTAMRKPNATNSLADNISETLEKRRERYPSDSNSMNKSCDSSPNGTQRGPRIRTSDWIEVGDNGKEVILSSCHISLEDSGLEDEEKLDDASSGVGDSWDSARDVEERSVTFSK